MTEHKMPRDVKEELFRKLRYTVAECGMDSLKNAVMVGMHSINSVSDIPYITCPTIGIYTLGNVDYEIARIFEDA